MEVSISSGKCSGRARVCSRMRVTARVRVQVKARVRVKASVNSESEGARDGGPGWLVWGWSDSARYVHAEMATPVILVRLDLGSRVQNLARASKSRA